MTETKQAERIPMVIITRPLLTRRDKRQAKRETAVVIKTLVSVDTAFNNAVLSDVTEDADSVTYEALYTIFLNAFNLKLRMLESKNLRIAMPNRRYFADSYAPKIAVNE